MKSTKKSNLSSLPTCKFLFSIHRHSRDTLSFHNGTSKTKEFPMSHIPSTIIHLNPSASERDICHRLRKSAQQFQGQSPVEISIEYTSPVVTPLTVATLMILKNTTHSSIRFSQFTHKLQQLLRQLNLMEHFEGFDHSASPSDTHPTPEERPIQHQFWI